MGETKVIKVRPSTIICIILIVLLIAGCGILFYFGFVQKGKQIEELEANKKELKARVSELESEINTLKEENKDLEDKVTELKKHMDLILNIDDEGNELKLLEGDAYIKDGYLYYSGSDEEEPRKIEGVSNIKSLNIYNIGTGVNRVPFVVTEDGTVYELNKDEKLVVYEELSDYKVDRIISCIGETDAVFTLLLLDGTTEVVTVDLGI